MANDGRTHAELLAENDKLRLVLSITRNNLNKALEQAAELEASLIIERTRARRLEAQQRQVQGPYSGTTVNV